ncbi:MAG: glycosyltransferase family 9 protein [Thermodesulfobacteriota bacterium]
MASDERRVRPRTLRRIASAVGGRIEGIGQRLLGRLLDLGLPVEANVRVDEVAGVRRVLLVRPNFRLGNALITSPLVAALRDRFPGARIDYLGGEGTLALLENLPVDERIVMSRGFVLRPWRFVALFLRLRRRAYDVAIEAAMGSFSGGLYAYLSGARFRVGVAGRSDRFLNVRLPPVPVTHAYDGPVAFAERLGVSCTPQPVYVLTGDEERAALATLASLDLADGDVVDPFVALFVGGHGKKRWPEESWVELAQRLAGEGARVVLFTGPDEAAAVARLRARLAGVAHVLEPQPLRHFAALLATPAIAVTPDSGPMHLAAALGVPCVAVLSSRGSTFFPPRGPLDVSLLEPSVEDVERALHGHPCWATIVGASRPPVPMARLA